MNLQTLDQRYRLACDALEAALDDAHARMRDAIDLAYGQLGDEGGERLEARLDRPVAALHRAQQQAGWALVALDLRDAPALLRHQRGIVEDLTIYGASLPGECGGRRAGTRHATSIAAAIRTMLRAARRFRDACADAGLVSRLTWLEGGARELRIIPALVPLQDRGLEVDPNVVEFRPRADVPRRRREVR